MHAIASHLSRRQRGQLSNLVASDSSLPCTESLSRELIPVYTSSTLVLMVRHNVHLGAEIVSHHMSISSQDFHHVKLNCINLYIHQQNCRLSSALHALELATIRGDPSNDVMPFCMGHVLTDTPMKIRICMRLYPHVSAQRRVQSRIKILSSISIKSNTSNYSKNTKLEALIRMSLMHDKSMRSWRLESSVSQGKFCHTTSPKP